MHGSSIFSGPTRTRGRCPRESTLALPTIVLRLSLAPWRATRPPVPASHARVAGDASTGRFYPLLPWRPAAAWGHGRISTPCGTVFPKRVHVSR